MVAVRFFGGEIVLAPGGRGADIRWVVRQEIWTPSGVVFAVVLGAVWLAGVIAVGVIARRSWQESRELKILQAARRQAHQASETVSRGLRTLATIVPELGDCRLALSARAMELLDSQSMLVMGLRGVGRKASFRRRRARMALARQLQEIAGLDRTFDGFQQAVLTAVCEQAAHRVVPPPVEALQYRAAFTVLDHPLPAVLWPTMNQILARHVRLWVRDARGTWFLARGVGFRWGRELLFSRKNLEEAVELRLVVSERVVSEFTVEHERPVTPVRRFFGRLLVGRSWQVGGEGLRLPKSGIYEPPGLRLTGRDR